MTGRRAGVWRPAGSATAAALVLFTLLVPAPPCSGAGRGAFSGLETGGSIRVLSSALRHYDNDLLFGEDNGVDGLTVTILRLTAEGDLGEGWKGELHIVQDFAASTAGGRRTAPIGGVAAGSGRYLLTDGRWRWAEDEDFKADLSVDRLNASLALGRWDITAGRQAITFAETWFWNPLDIFNPFDPEEFDRSYKPGVDALRADLALGPYSSLTLVYSPGRAFRLKPIDDGFELVPLRYSDEPWEGAALLSRLRANAAGWDLVMQGGKVYGGYQAGAGFSGDLLALGIRGEATWFFAVGGGGPTLPGEGGSVPAGPLIDDHGSLVIGADYRLTHSLYTALEYFWNGAGDDDNLPLAAARVAAGETTNLSEHLLGALLTYEFHPLLTGRLTWIQSISDGSALVSPVFTWSVAEEAECLLGGIVGFGERPGIPEGSSPGAPSVVLNSEFGSYSDFYFLEVIFYF